MRLQQNGKGQLDPSNVFFGLFQEICNLFFNKNFLELRHTKI